MKTKQTVNILITSTLLLAILLQPLRAAAGDLAGPGIVYLPLVTTGWSSLALPGFVKYTLDASRRASATYADDGTPAQLSVTDANGFLWILTVPYGALFYSQPITLTPFATVSVSGAAITLTSGVDFQPDGLQFNMPVTLTVTSPQANPGIGVIFSFLKGGSHLLFAPTTDAGNTAVSQIWHFSGAAASYVDDSDPYLDYLQQQAIQEYKLAVDAGRQFVKAPTPTPPTPPNISLYCMGTSVNPVKLDFNEYVQEFEMPYEDITNVLASALHAMSLLSVDMDTSEGYALLAKITGIAYNQALKLGNQYQDEKPPDHLPAVVPAALEMLRRYQLLGGSNDGMDIIGGWTLKLRDYYFDQLKKSHEYRAYPMVIDLDRWAALLGVEPDTNQFLQKVADAMTFKLIIDNTFDMGSSQSKVHLTQSGTKTGFTLNLQSSHVIWDSNINVNYTGGSFQSRALNLPLSYNSNLYMDYFDACVFHEADIYLVKLGSPTETYSGLPGQYGFAGAISILDYGSLQVPPPNIPNGFKFTVKLTEQGETAVDDTISKTGSNSSSAQTHIQLVHTPK